VPPFVVDPHDSTSRQRPKSFRTDTADVRETACFGVSVALRERFFDSFSFDSRILSPCWTLVHLGQSVPSAVRALTTGCCVCSFEATPCGKGSLGPRFQINFPPFRPGEPMAHVVETSQCCSSRQQGTTRVTASTVRNALFRRPCSNGFSEGGSPGSSYRPDTDIVSRPSNVCLLSPRLALIGFRSRLLFSTGGKLVTGRLSVEAQENLSETTLPGHGITVFV